jgi:cell wall-associated NlpC family hydrolase
LHALRGLVFSWSPVDLKESDAVRPFLLRRRAVAAAVAATLALTTVAVDASTGLAAPQADIQDVEAQVRDLQMQAGAAHEEATRASDRLDKVQRELSDVRGRLANEREGLRLTQSALGDLARSLYAAGGIDPSLELLLAEDPVEFLAQASVMNQVAASQASSIRQAQTSRLRLAQTQAELSDQEAQAKALEEERSAAMQRVSQRLDEAQGILDNLRQEERDRLARLQAERQQRQRAEARQAASSVPPITNGPAQTPADDSPTASETGAGGGYTGGTRAQRAVDYALSQVGDPYSYSARPPDSWDCSKLTSAAWAQSGVGLTALSYTQWDQTQRIPVSEIQPGDLVFYFGSGAHHVAIYVGNGKMVSASNPSDGVELIDFLGPWYGERFSGVGRVIA